MIIKIEKQNVTYIEVFYNKENKNKIVNNCIKEIEKIKLFPFSRLFIKIPIIIFEQFLNKLKEKNIVYKQLSLKKNIAIFEL